MRKLNNIIKQLIKAANKSHARCKHAAAVVKNGKILSIGYNYAKKNNGFHSIHAERDALIKCSKQNIKGASLYVIRWNHSKVNRKYDNFLLSKPCPTCHSLIINYIQKYNLKKVYYSI